MLDIDRLDELPRSELIEIGRRHGIERPERMTRVELRDELVRLTVTDEAVRHTTRGWFGVARDLVASVVEAGLHLPDAAKVIRGEEGSAETPIKRPPVATVTLAEIYAAQGHVQRAMKMLDQVLRAEPDHELAQLLRERLASKVRGEPSADEVPSKPPPRVSLTGVLGSRVGDFNRVDDMAEVEAKPLDEAEDPPESGEVEVQPLSSITAQDAPHEPTSALEGTAPQAAEGAAVQAPAVQSDLLLTVRDAEASIVYWELGADSLARGRAFDPDGRTVLRLVGMKPAWQGAERFEQEVEVDGVVGRRALVLPPECRYSRAAIGWRASAGFLPLAVAVEIGPTGEVEFQPPGASEELVLRALDRVRNKAAVRAG